jgi:eukaryotic-like serine/threonine-protein kinase
MKLTAGVVIGAYEVMSVLGSGGMGDVYRARDSKLRRDVALKILPEDFAADEGRLSRFRREAELLASLNHPNIAAIYGLEDTSSTMALVLELVEGGTLADRLARGPLPFSHTLDIARQLAGALEAAHERGIVHRDLKPANIGLTPRGAVKVLDFGIAAVRTPSTTDDSTAPTVTATMPGTILGTPSYMAPEQATGLPADRGADMWAFGCVVYEMLTGRRAFEGRTSGEIVANVLKSEAEFRRLPEDTPSSIRRLLRRCLEKDQQKRLRDIRDARLEIEDAASGTSSEPVRAHRRTARRERLLWTAAGVAAVTAAGLALTAYRPAVAAPEVRFEIQPPPGANASVALSPDGLHITYSGRLDGVSHLWLRALASTTATPIPGTERGAAPFWSPDSRSIAFFVDGALKRVDLDGGSPRTLTSPVPTATGGSWNADGTILFGANPSGPLLRLPPDGGDAVPATELRPGERNHMFPQFLPDGRRFLFFVTAGPDQQGVYVGTLGSQEVRRLVEADGPGTLAQNRLLFVRQGALWSQAFDHARLELEGAPTAVESVKGNAALSSSASGPIAFRQVSENAERRRLSWIDRTGMSLRSVEYVDGAALGPAWSNDGRHVALFRYANSNMDIWSFALVRGTWDRMTVDPADDILPLWSPDDTHIIFGSRRSGRMDLYRKRIGSAPGDEELLLSTPDIKLAMDWSADGQFLLYGIPAPKRGFDIWALPLAGKSAPFPVLQTEFDEVMPQVSPSGRWLAYQSNRTGRHEIYLRPFPGGGPDLPVSSHGGTEPRWNPDGTELFYLTPGSQLTRVALRFSDDERRVELEVPRELFAMMIPDEFGPVARQRYAVASDGQSFLVQMPAGDVPTLPITVILNWDSAR